jgi:CHRD domain/IPTL-CTERM motif
MTAGTACLLHVGLLSWEVGMKSLLALVVGIVFAVAGPLALAAQFNALVALTGAKENPANTSPGLGSAEVTLDTTAHTLRVNVIFTGLTAGTTASHLHCCVAPPGNAGVATTTPSFVGFPLGVTSGSMDRTYDTTLASSWNNAFITANGGTPASAEAALANGIQSGGVYLNIHTTAFPGGEIRGFLTAFGQATGPSDIPTLSEWALILLVIALTTTAWLVLRRRTR